MIWEIATAASKWLLYGALAAAVGGPLVLLLWTRGAGIRALALRYVLPASVLGIIAGIAGLLLQVGAFAEAGFSGMFDPLYLAILWQSAAGDVLLLQSLGFGVSALGALFLTRDMRGIAVGLFALGAVMVILPFAWRGHTADASLWVRAALLLHLLCAALWMGALYPLWHLCRNGGDRDLQPAMHQFGQLGGGLVALLLVGGAAVLWALLGDLRRLGEAGYGLGLTLKLVLVAALLLFAARNKWQLVPGLRQPAGTAKLARSVRAEMLLGGVILLTTALVTTLLGPGNQ